MDRAIIPTQPHLTFGELPRIQHLAGAVLAVGLGLGFAWGAAAAQATTGFAQWPDECHAQSTTESGLRTGVEIPVMLGSRLSKLEQIAKYDVLCVGKSVTISTPILTNGGDVVIFADSLRISAPIRTTIGLPYSFEQHFLEPYKGLRWRPGETSIGYKNVLSVIRKSRLSGTRSLEQAYREHYRCDDSITRGQVVYCFDRPSGLTHPFFDWALSKTHIAYGYRQHDGVPAPDAFIDEDTYRSGSIYIFAKTLIVDDGVAVSVEGNNGSVGGLGQPPGCIGPNSEGDISCLGYGLGALSAPGGKGGDAGDIFLFGTSGQSLSSTSIKSSPGRAGPPELRRSPRGEAYKFSGKLDKDFPIESTATELPMAGSEGDIVSSVVAPAVALDVLLSIAHARDTLVAYDMGEMGLRAEADSSVTATGWVDYIGQKSADLIRSEQTAVVDSALATLLSEGPMLVSSAPTMICPGPPLATTHPSRARNLIARAAPYCGPTENKFVSYLTNTGGLLRIEDSDPGRTVVLEGIRFLLSDNSESLAGIRGDLANVNEQLLNIYTTVERATVEAELGRLDSRIAEVDAAIEELRNRPSNLEALVLVATEANALRIAARKFGKSLESRSVDSKKFRESGRELATSVGKANATLAAVMQRGDATDSIAELEARRAALAEQSSRLRAALSEFLLAQAIRIERIKGVKLDRLRIALGARARREAIGAEVNRHFENVLKRTVLSFLLDRSLDKEALRTNLLTLRALTTNPKDQAFSFAFPALLPPCQETGPTTAGACFALEHDAPLMVFASPATDPQVSIPVYVVRVGRVGDQLSTFGLRNLSQETNVPLPPPSTF